jgi:hypothetical protein
MPLYVIDPGFVSVVFDGPTHEPISGDGWGWTPGTDFPRPPNRECFISWGEPITVEVEDPAAKVALVNARLRLIGEALSPEEAKGLRIQLELLGVHVFDPEEEGQPWSVRLYVRETDAVPGRSPGVWVYPLDLALATDPDFDEEQDERVFTCHRGALWLAHNALMACTNYRRARQEVSKARRKKMRKHGQLPPSAFYVVSQEPIRQHQPHQGGTHASPSFEFDVRGHWAFRVKRVQGELTSKERERWTRKNTDRRQYQFIEHPPTPEQHQFLRDIGRTPPGKGQYVRVTKYWVNGHTRGPEDAPHVHAIKVMDGDNSAGVVL